LQIAQIFRYAKDKAPDAQFVDGLPNYWNVTHLAGQARAQLESGINPIAVLKGRGRRPAILVSSSPHRVGSAQTPWQDVFDVDNGRIRYFGDAKTPGADPALSPGNKLLLQAHMVHSAIDPDERSSAVPVIFFQRTSVGGKAKGFARFQGFGVIERAERTTQFDLRKGASFTNYVYDFAVLSMARENEIFDWNWINCRRNPDASDAECLKSAPASWREWLKGGESALPRVRRRAAKLSVVDPKDQLPEKGSKTEKVLQQIYAYYDNRKHRFEGLAYAVTKRLLSASHGLFVDGWITPLGSDGGADFIARLDIGEGFGALKQIVYGQAKCEAPSGCVNGKDIARTVARLKRGWFGVFVTTSSFSKSVQLEIIEDEYPLLLVSGGEVAMTALLLAEERGCSGIAAYLDLLDAEFDEMKARRRPEEILHF